MVFTLHRYVFRELFRVFALAAIALTLILSLCSILEPVQSYGAGPRQVIRFIGYSLPLILTFVLPVAALFAGALVYGRFASDNELDACKASGISLTTLVYPGLALAMMVAIANLILSFHVTPASIERAEKSLKADAKQIVFRNIQRKGYYEPPSDSHGHYRILADLSDPQNNTLSGVIVVRIEKREIKHITTAQTAKVNFDTHSNLNEARITVYKPRQIRPGRIGESRGEVNFRIEFGSLLGDDIKFKRVNEIKEIEKEPILFSPIKELAGETYAQLTTELLARDIIRTFDADEDGWYDLLGEPNSVKFRADHCVIDKEEDGRLVLSGHVSAVEYDTTTAEVFRSLQCEKASLQIEGNKFAPTLEMDFQTPNWQKLDGTKGSALRVVRHGLLPPDFVISEIEAPDVLRTLRPSSVASILDDKQSAKLQNLAKELQNKIKRTLAEIKAEIHTRLVFGIGCIPMMLIGVGLGIIKRGGHPLTAFGISCIPVVLLVACILAGRNVTKNLGAQAISGIGLMWAGVIVLCLFVLLIYRRLLKN